jgi:NADPH2:quinone reductase
MDVLGCVLDSVTWRKVTVIFSILKLFRGRGLIGERNTHNRRAWEIEMRAVELNGYDGLDSLRVVEIPTPKVAANECLIEVKATGINFAELELTRGRSGVGKEPPFIMGFEAAGVVRAIGASVGSVKVGDRVTAIASSGGYAQYATAVAAMAIPIPQGISYAEATTIPIQGLTAHLLLTQVARVQPPESLLIQAAAGGVGTYLVQLAKILGVRKVIALVGSPEKVDVVESLGADIVVDTSKADWGERVFAATDGVGVNVVMEAAAGDFGKQSFRLLAPFGRMIMFGARNAHDTFGPKEIQQLIYKNQTISAFNLPSYKPEDVAASVGPLVELIAGGKLRLIVSGEFPLDRVKDAFEAFASRQTIGKVVLIPNDTTPAAQTEPRECCVGGFAS